LGLRIQDSMSDSNQIKILFEGPFFLNESLAHVNRSLASQWMEQHPGQVLLHPLEVAGEAAIQEAYAGLISQTTNTLGPNNKIILRHSWPPIWSKPPGQKLILIQPWELSSLPASWVKPFSEEVDEIWVPSQFVKNVFCESTIRPDKITVIPNGINPSVMTPDGPTPRLPLRARTVFLFVGGSIPRKGIDVLLTAWKKTFGPNDDVLLIIKDMGTKGTYQKTNLASQIQALAQDSEAAPILYIDNDLSEIQMAGLYRIATCLVAPYRGEGFCLPVLEALACGTGVLTTQGGPTDEFIGSFANYSIKASVKPVTYSEPTFKPAFWFEPDLNDLCDKLKWVSQNSDEFKQSARDLAPLIATNWSWQQAAQKGWERLKKFW
jgi:glycosyltransferase involved in cell wall biosynthesis